MAKAEWTEWTKWTEWTEWTEWWEWTEMVSATSVVDVSLEVAEECVIMDSDGVGRREGKDESRVE